MSNLRDVDQSWYEPRWQGDNADFEKVVEEVWPYLKTDTRVYLSKRRPKGKFGMNPPKFETNDAHRMDGALPEDASESIRRDTRAYINTYFKLPPPSGGKNSKKIKKSRKSRKSTKSKKSTKSTKSTKSRKSRKFRKFRKSRKSRKFRKSRKIKGGGYRIITPNKSCPFTEGKLLSN